MAGPGGPGDAPVYLVKGDDPALVAQEAHALINRLVGGRDPALVVEEHGGGSADDLDVGAVVDACTTPPFLIDRRVVVVREAGRLNAADAGRLVTTLADPLPTSILVLVGGGGAVPQALTKSVSAVGVVVDTSVGTARDRKTWLVDHVKEGPVKLNAAAANLLGEHLGEDLGRLAGILQTLASAYGEGAHIGPSEVAPYLGEAGKVPSWDLTDAIDRGDPAALGVLHRMVVAGGLAPPQVLAIVHNHYAAMLALDGADVASPDEAAQLLGMRSPFRAKKALEQSRRLGGERIAAAVGLVAEADLDVKGRTALPPDLVLEILVARLSRLVRARSSSSRR